jgi:hypothetical protein
MAGLPVTSPSVMVWHFVRLANKRAMDGTKNFHAPVVTPPIEPNDD